MTAVYEDNNNNNNKLALNELYKETVHPEAAFLVAVDFNDVSLRHVMDSHIGYLVQNLVSEKMMIST